MHPSAAPLRVNTAAGRGTLLATVVASGMAFLDATVVNVALPRLGDDLRATVSDLQWTVDGYLLVLAAFVLLGGALGDRYGRRRIFLLGVAWFTAASLLCGLAQSMEWLITARFLQGAGGALLTPGSLALLQASFHPDDRGRAIGLWSGLSGVSTAVGPLIGGWLIDAVSWRWIFLMNLLLAAIVILAAVRWIPASTAPAGRRAPDGGFDRAGAGLGATGLAAITYALIEATHGPASFRVLGSLLLGVLATGLFVRVERRRREAAMLPPTLFTNRLFTVLNGYTVLVYAALSGLTFFLAVYLQNAAGYSALATGLATLPLTVLLLLGSGRAGALSARIGPRAPLTVGPLLAAAGLFLLSGVDTATGYWRGILPGVTLFGLGMTLVVAPLTTSVLAAVADRFAGVASGFNNAAARAGGLLAVASLPLLVGLSGTAYTVPAELTSAYRGALLWCAGLMLAAAGMALLLVRQPPDAGRAPD